MRTTALVPARGGSKGLPGKNLARLGSVSLLGHAIRVAQSVPAIDDVVVSSDDDEILREAITYGAHAARRAPHLARDETSTLEVVTDHLDGDPDVDTLVILQPTSPLRAPVDVQACLDALRHADTATTVTACEHPPAWSFELDEQGALSPLLGWEAVASRRQSARPAYRLNGAVYAARAPAIRAGGQLVTDRTVGVVMPSGRSVDIDTPLDLEVARLLMDRPELGDQPS